MATVITISREFGSGGRELGKRLGDILGFKYYDREIIEAIAKETSFDEHYIEKTLEGGIGSAVFPITFSHSFGYLTQLDSNYIKLFACQNKIVKSLPEAGDCIIVGRCADTLLAEYNPVKVFVYAAMPSKVERCRERAPKDEHFTDKQLIKRIKKIDKARKQTHDMYSPFSWGDKRGYHLCVNTTDMEIKKLAPVVAEYLKVYIEKAAKQQTDKREN